MLNKTDLCDDVDSMSINDLNFPKIDLTEYSIGKQPTSTPSSPFPVIFLSLKSLARKVIYFPFVCFSFLFHLLFIILFY